MQVLACSITYNFNQADESFEWYDLRHKNQDECKVLKGRVDVLAKSTQAPAARAPAQNGLRKTGIKKHFASKVACAPAALAWFHCVLQQSTSAVMSWLKYTGNSGSVQLTQQIVSPVGGEH